MHKAKVYTHNVFLEYFETQTQMIAKPFRWHDSLALMKVDLIHKSDCDNVVLDALSWWEEFQEMSTIQTLWLMSTSEGNLWCKIREGYLNYLKVQRLLGELHKGKALKNIKLVDGLFKYKQSQVYVLQVKLRPLVLKEKYESPIVDHRERKTII